MDFIRKPSRETETVEVNLKNSHALIVESSEASELTHDILAIKAKPIQIVEIRYDGKAYQIHVRHGKELGDELKSKRISLEYGSDASINFMLSKMIANPLFSWNGEGEGDPIEDISYLLKEKLCEACLVVNDPTEDDIYQVEVYRGIPDEILQGVNALLPTQSPNEMTDDDLIKNEKAYHIAQQKLVVAMIASPVLSESECERTDAYPVSSISVGMMQTFFNAVGVINVLRSTQTV